MKFSIITIVYNGRQYIAETIRSVIAQDYSCFEYIIVDGGSTDGTLDIIKSFAASDSRIRWISEADNGISDAMNKGIALATGDVIAHLHSDDFYEPHTLKVVASAFAAEQKALWAVGNYYVVDALGKMVFSCVAKQDINFENLLIKNLVPHPAAFVRRECFSQWGQFDERLKYAMDYDFFLRLCKESTPLMVAGPLVSFRRHAGSVSTVLEVKAYKEEHQIRMNCAAGRSLCYRINLLLRYFYQLTIMRLGLHNARKRFLSKLGLCP